MNARLAIILSGSLLISAVGGFLAALPVIRAAEEAAIPVERAPAPDLERMRLAVLASLQATTNGVADRAGHLELLAELMAENSRPTVKRAHASDMSDPSEPEHRRRDPILR